jgi:hypothetical protein
MDESRKNLEELSNNEILFQIKQFEADHEALKLKMLKDYDKMIELEKRFDQANKILLKRLKGEA